MRQPPMHVFLWRPSWPPRAPMPMAGLKIADAAPDAKYLDAPDQIERVWNVSVSLKIVCGVCFWVPGPFLKNDQQR